jgi:hypothetical protein
MSERIAFLLFVLPLSVYSCAQEVTVEHSWTDKNNTEMYAAAPERLLRTGILGSKG